jgi:hypothetical protein
MSYDLNLITVSLILTRSNNKLFLFKRSKSGQYGNR